MKILVATFLLLSLSFVQSQVTFPDDVVKRTTVKRNTALESTSRTAVSNAKSSGSTTPQNLSLKSNANVTTTSAPAKTSTPFKPSATSLNTTITRQSAKNMTTPMTTPSSKLKSAPNATTVSLSTSKNPTITSSNTTVKSTAKTTPGPSSTIRSTSATTGKKSNQSSTTVLKSTTAATTQKGPLKANVNATTISLTTIKSTLAKSNTATTKEALKNILNTTTLTTTPTTRVTTPMTKTRRRTTSTSTLPTTYSSEYGSDYATESFSESSTDMATEKPTANGCLCVPSGSCSRLGGNGTSYNDGSGQLDPRIVNPARGPLLPSGTNSSITYSVASGIPLISEPETDCSEYSDFLDLCCPSNGYQCGKSFPPLQGSRKLGGRSAFGEFPWQGIVFTTVNNYVGSGVLIDQFNFLTVAHKLNRFPNSSFQVRMGDWDTSTRSEPLPYLNFKVSKVTIHPKYVASSLKNSIAILRLAEVPLGRFPTISTACLPATLLSNMRCFVSGWGRNDFAYGSNQAIQRKVDVPLVDHDTCQGILRMTRLGNRFILDRGFLCAGGEIGKDACTGDGGAPLVCQVAGTWYAVGLVAWGINCGQNIPGVYMDINYYIPWIQSVTSSA